MPARPRAACARDRVWEERATAAPRDGNWPGHEWERCSIHKRRSCCSLGAGFAGNPQPAGAAPPSASKSPLTLCSRSFGLR